LEKQPWRNGAMRGDKPILHLCGDHAGYKIKEHLKPWLEQQGYRVKDHGPHRYDKTDDYPDYVIPMVKEVATEKNARGIIIAGSGQGEVIAANRIPGVRAALYYGAGDLVKILRLSRAHNNSNVLSLAAFFTTEKKMKEAILIWLAAPFSNEERHKRRLRKIERNI